MIGSFEPGQVISGGYKLIKMVGRGTYGEVWQAVDTALNSEVAIKFILRIPTSKEASEAVVEEGYKLRKLASSQQRGAYHIVYCNRASPATENTPPFLDLEWMGGGSLSERLKPGRPMSQDAIFELAVQIGQALLCAHRHPDGPIIHCDVKPQNVLLSADGRLFKLADFGLARRFGELAQGSWGTPAYMSPEQFRGQRSISDKTDIYSLGVMLYQCAEGRLPFEGRNRHDFDHKHCQMPVPPMENPLIAPEMKALILDCLKKQPQDRPDAERFLDRLAQIGQFESVGEYSQLNLESLSSRPEGVLHRETGILFRPASSGRRVFLPDRVVTNQDAYRFMGDRRFRKWSPGAIAFNRFDGCYLQHWFLSKPMQRDLDQPLCSIPYEVAVDLASWFVGVLPSYEEMEGIFYGGDAPDLASRYREFLARSELPFLQFWCRDETGQKGIAAMWRLMRDGSSLARHLVRVRRPIYYCFPYYVFLPVIAATVAENVIDSTAFRPPSLSSESLGASSVLSSQGGRSASADFV